MRKRCLACGTLNDFDQFACSACGVELGKISSGVPLGLVPQPPAPLPPTPGRPRELAEVESPFMWSMKQEAAMRRKYLLAMEWAIAATIAALIGWGFWAVAVYQMSKGL